MARAAIEALVLGRLDQQAGEHAARRTPTIIGAIARRRQLEIPT